MLCSQVVSTFYARGVMVELSVLLLFSIEELVLIMLNNQGILPRGIVGIK